MMQAYNSTNTPPMWEFTVSNSLLGDREALQKAWERDGYWFFRDVLDQDAVKRLAATYLDVLKESGFVNKSATEAIHNDADLARFPLMNHSALERDPLVILNPMKSFVSEHRIHAFFIHLFGEEPVWLPVTEYQVTPSAKIAVEHDSILFIATVPSIDAFLSSSAGFRCL